MQQNKNTARGGKPFTDESTPKRSFMNRLRSRPLWWTAACRCSALTRKEPHAEAMFMHFPCGILEGDVMTFCRIQDRLFRLTNGEQAADAVSDGLIGRLLKDYPDKSQSPYVWGHLTNQRLLPFIYSHCRTPHPKE